jgi:hypothetical protein
MKISKYTWLFPADNEYYIYHDAMDCGPTCLRMIVAHYDRLASPKPPKTSVSKPSAPAFLSLSGFKQKN